MGTFRINRLLGGWKRINSLPRSCRSISSQSVVWKTRHEKVEVTRELLSEHTFDSTIFPLTGVLVDDRTPASKATRFIRSGKAIVYEGDYHNAKQLLAALKRRLVSNEQVSQHETDPISQQWKIQRKLKEERTRLLNMLLVQVENDHTLISEIRRAPNVVDVLHSHFGKQDDSYVIPLRDLLGMIGAHEWKKKGVFIPQTDELIHPHYGVFVPSRREYLDLILEAPLPSPAKQLSMMEVGIGTGVITATMLLKRNVEKVVGTDVNPDAIACAQDNLSRLNLSNRVELIQTDIFPSVTEKVDLVVCNPPWLPGIANSLMDLAVYDNDLSMLRRFLLNAKHHLRSDQSEVWLILSTMAELLELRSRQDLLKMIDDGDLILQEILETRPVHTRARCLKKKNTDEFSAISAARASERTLLFRLKQKL